jgi:metal-responsive CopG/Arc/MetJ family transcriptional regulator
MKGPAKLSERVAVSITYEMGVWLDAIVVEAEADGRSAIIRSMLQTLMDEDIREQCNRPAQMPGGQGVGA